MSFIHSFTTHVWFPEGQVHTVLMDMSLIHSFIHNTNLVPRGSGTYSPEDMSYLLSWLDKKKTWVQLQRGCKRLMTVLVIS